MMKKSSFRLLLTIMVMSWFSFGLIALLPVDSPAQEGGIRGEVISPGMAPFTETWEQMQKRDAEYQAAVAAGTQAPRIKRTSPRPLLSKPGGAGAPAPLAPSIEAPFPPPGPAAPVTIGTSFQAINLQDEDDDFFFQYIPPDTMGAVGPNHFLEVINGSVTAYDKTGVQASRVTLDTFFTLVIGPDTYPRNGAFDPRVLYDKQSGRWFAIALDFGVGDANNDILLAVSQTSDPTGAWDKYVIPVGEVGNFTDFDTLGVDSNGVYFGMSMCPLLCTYAKIAATPKANLLAGSLGTVTAWSSITDMYSSPQPAHNHDTLTPSDPFAPAWFVSSSTDVFGNVNYRTLTWSGGVPTLSNTSVLTTPTYSMPPNAPASGSTISVETGDYRLMMAVVRNNRLWTARHVGLDSAGGPGTSRTGAEWLELNVTTTTASLVQSGRVYDSAASNPRFYYYPSIMVNANGDAVMGFSGSKTTEFIGAYVCGRLAADTLNTMGPVTLLKAGEASYTLTFGSGRNRWGDYSYTSLDPTDDLTFWTIQEYAETHGADTANGNWGTWVAKININYRSLQVNSTNPNSLVIITVAPVDITGQGDGITPFSRAYNPSAVVNLTAPASAGGNNFLKWQRNGVDYPPATPATSVTMDANYTMTAIFQGVDRILTVNSTPNTGLNITVSPNDNFGSGSGATNFTRTYVNNTIVSLTAPGSDGSGNVFQKWQLNGADYSTNAAATVTMDNDHTMLAVYVPPPRILTVNSANPASGVAITVTPNDNFGQGNGTTSFTRSYLDGTPVNLTAPATAGGNNFLEWRRNGVFYDNNQTTAVTMDANYTMTAVYAVYRTLTVNSSSPASGVTITVTPNDRDGLGDGATPFTRTYLDSTVVNLTAPAVMFSNNFQKWQRNGADYDVNPATSVTVNNNYTMTAVYAVTAPSTPTNLTAVIITANQVDLAWVDNSTNEFGFRILRRKGSFGSYIQIATVGADVTAYSDTTVVKGATYSYYVCAYNDFPTPACTNPVTIKVSKPPAPKGLLAAAVSNTQINLLWVDKSNNELGFRIERKTGALLFAEISTVGPNVTTYNDTTAVPNTTYTYRVRAYNVLGNSYYSNKATATTLP